MKDYISIISNLFTRINSNGFILIIIGVLFIVLSTFSIFTIPSTNIEIDIPNNKYLLQVIGTICILPSILILFFTKNKPVKKDFNSPWSGEWVGYAYREKDLDTMTVEGADVKMVSKQSVKVSISSFENIINEFKGSIVFSFEHKEQASYFTDFNGQGLIDKDNPYFSTMHYFTKEDSSTGVVLAKLSSDKKNISAHYLIKSNMGNMDTIRIFGSIKLKKV